MLGFTATSAKPTALLGRVRCARVLAREEGCERARIRRRQRLNHQAGGRKCALTGELLISITIQKLSGERARQMVTVMQSPDGLNHIYPHVLARNKRTINCRRRGRA